jgi:hypothetical protein
VRRSALRFNADQDHLVLGVDLDVGHFPRSRQAKNRRVQIAVSHSPNVIERPREWVSRSPAAPSEVEAEGGGAKGERQRALEPEVQGAGALPTQIPDDPRKTEDGYFATLPVLQDFVLDVEIGSSPHYFVTRTNVRPVSNDRSEGIQVYSDWTEGQGGWFPRAIATISRHGEQESRISTTFESVPRHLDVSRIWQHFLAQSQLVIPSQERLDYRASAAGIEHLARSTIEDLKIVSSRPTEREPPSVAMSEQVVLQEGTPDWSGVSLEALTDHFPYDLRKGYCAQSCLIAALLAVGREDEAEAVTRVLDRPSTVVRDVVEFLESRDVPYRIGSTRSITHGSRMIFTPGAQEIGHAIFEYQRPGLEGIRKWVPPDEASTLRQPTRLRERSVVIELGPGVARDDDETGGATTRKNILLILAAVSAALAVSVYVYRRRTRGERVREAGTLVPLLIVGLLCACGESPAEVPLFAIDPPGMIECDLLEECTVPVTFRSGDRAVTIRVLQATCGCVSIPTESLTLSARSAGQLRLRARPSAPGATTTEITVLGAVDDLEPQRITFPLVVSCDVRPRVSPRARYITRDSFVDGMVVGEIRYRRDRETEADWLRIATNGGRGDLRVLQGPTTVLSESAQGELVSTDLMLYLTAEEPVGVFTETFDVRVDDQQPPQKITISVDFDT